MHDIERLMLALVVAAAVATEHFFGCLDYEEALGFLQDYNRMLETGGTRRIIVPDLEMYIRAYAAGDAAFFNPLRQLGVRSNR